ncbi:MAG: ribosome biogenesis GTPase YlqF [Eubacteriales bacterium]|nr:ribosome biogenesis GTPase YlqF [Christensenellaceae bacterium]MDY2751051.1 ribosome biogenesis GTPase YlqF [Eubacteriales bacterium]
MNINWFPGHMTKAMRLIEENIKIVDAVIYVLDSRAVSACMNPSFDGIIGNKPILYVLNKADLVEERDLKKWCDYFDEKKYNYVVSNSANGKDNDKILKKLLFVLDDKIKRYREKGVNTPVRAMVIGIPNSGKSTLINSLCGGKRTITGDRPGVTKSKQWLAVRKGVDMLDTPGTLWPKLDDQNVAMHLAFIGSIKDDVVDKNEVALNIIDFLKTHNPGALTERYKISDENAENIQIFEEISVKRGFIMKGGDYDFERTASAVIDDFRKRKFGKIMLEYPYER